jgi:hypothetical protein
MPARCRSVVPDAGPAPRTHAAIDHGDAFSGETGDLLVGMAVDHRPVAANDPPPRHVGDAAPEEGAHGPRRSGKPRFGRDLAVRDHLARPQSMEHLNHPGLEADLFHDRRT